MYALVVKALQNEDILDKLINKSKILIKEQKLDPWLVRILITELLFGKKRLSAISKSIQTVLSYHDVLLAALKEEEEAGVVNLDSNQSQGNVKLIILKFTSHCIFCRSSLALLK